MQKRILFFAPYFFRPCRQVLTIVAVEPFRSAGTRRQIQKRQFGSATRGAVGTFDCLLCAVWDICRRGLKVGLKRNTYRNQVFGIENRTGDVQSIIHLNTRMKPRFHGFVDLNVVNKSVKLRFQKRIF